MVVGETAEWYFILMHTDMHAYVCTEMRVGMTWTLSGLPPFPPPATPSHPPTVSGV